jgi:hypothetical protein
VVGRLNLGQYFILPWELRDPLVFCRDLLIANRLSIIDYGIQYNMPLLYIVIVIVYSLCFHIKHVVARS